MNPTKPPQCYARRRRIERPVFLGNLGEVWIGMISGLFILDDYIKLICNNSLSPCGLSTCSDSVRTHTEYLAVVR